MPRSASRAYELVAAVVLKRALSMYGRLSMAACLAVMLFSVVPTAADASSVGSPSVSLSTVAAGAPAVTYVVQFTTSSTGELLSDGTITLTVPSGTVFTQPIDIYDVTAGQDLGLSNNGTPPTVSDGGTTATWTVGGGQVLPAGHVIRLTITGTTNPGVGGYEIGVSTSSDPTVLDTPSYTITPAQSVGSPSVSVSTPAAGATEVTYTVQFTTSSTGELLSDGTITLTAPSGTVFTQPIDIDDLTAGQDLGESNNGSPPTVSDGGATATWTVCCSSVVVPAGHVIKLTITGVTNPAVGAFQLGVSTSSDSTIAYTPSYSTTPTPTSCVTAPSALVPCAAATPGFAGRSVPARSELTLAPRQLASVLRAGHGAATTFAWTAVGQGSLLIVAWQLKTAQAATRALQTWRAAVAQRHPASLKLGAGAFLLLDASGAKTPGLAVVRVGPVIAALRLETSASGTPIDDFLAGEAGSEAQQISTALSQTGYDRLSYEIAQHNGPTPTLALQAFALIGGHGPGVPNPISNAGAIDGTEALDWVLQELPHFSKAQRTAVHAYLARTFAAPAAYVDPLNAYPAMTAPTPEPDCQYPPPIPATNSQPYYFAIACEMLQRIETHTGPLGITPVVVKDTTSDPGQYAMTDPLASCDIAVYQTNDDKPLSFKQRTLAHELGHCMQIKYAGDAAQHTPLWLNEGLATWIADEVVPLGPSDHPSEDERNFRRLTAYDHATGVPLRLDQYDAVGFFGHVADVAGEDTLWNRIPLIMAQEDTPGGLQATVQSNAQEVYDTWGGSYAQRTDLGTNWERINPYPATATATQLGDDGIQPNATQVPVPDGSVTLFAEPGTGWLYQIRATQPLVRIETYGKVFGRLADNSGMDVQIDQTAGKLYCTTGSCDTCPAGTEGTPPPSVPITMPLLIGLSGGTPDADGGGGGWVVLTGEPWSTFCTPSTPPPGSGGSGGGSTGGNGGTGGSGSGTGGSGSGTGGSGSGSTGGSGSGAGGSVGDPHLTDFDSDLFDLQQAGEFTLLKSTQDDLQIQVRQQPALGCLGPSSVAVNTAVAMRVASATVEVDLDRQSPSGFAVYVNGMLVHAASITLGRGHLTIQAGEVDVAWPDGTTADVLRIVVPGGSSALNVGVRLANERQGHVEGLLGNWDVPTSSEFVGRNGRRYAQSTILGDINVRYHQFAASWRITQPESLFMYPRGKSTSSYAIPGFPQKPLTLATLPAARLAAGEKACTAAGITNPGLYAACVLDVGATCAPAFASGDQQFGQTVGLPSGRTFDVTVPGTADIFGAGQAEPPALDGNPGPGTGGGTMPPGVGFVSAPGEVLMIPSVTGAVYCDSSKQLTSTPNGPCGGNSSPTDLIPVGPISGIVDSDSNDFLTGVFLSAAQPTGAPPSSLDFSSSAIGDNYFTLSPQLGQTFFIGNGRASSGALHEIVVPAGATRLFLGIADGFYFQGDPGYYDDDGGAYQATVDFATCPAAPVDAYAKAVLGDAPLVYYPLDEQSGTTMCDDSGNSNDGGYASAGAKYGVSGPLKTDASQTGVSGDGSAADLIGTGPGLSGLSGNHSFTLEGWFKGSASSPNEVLVALTGGSDAGLAIWKGHCDNGTDAYIALDEYGVSNCWDAQAIAGINLQDGSWHYLAITYDASASTDQLSAYVDGRDLGAQTISNHTTTPINWSKPTVRVGNWVDNNVNQPFSGDAAQIAVYPSALSASDIEAHYTAAG